MVDLKFNSYVMFSISLFELFDKFSIKVAHFSLIKTFALYVKKDLLVYEKDYKTLTVLPINNLYDHLYH